VGKHGSLGRILAGAVSRLQRWLPRRFGSARPYRVRAVRHERGGATTLELEAEGHGGARFEPGQFARIRAAGAPDRPLPFASSAEHPEAPALTFDDDLPAVEPGARVLLDGPHGSSEAPLPDAGYVLVCEGIGIAPALSLLRTLADRGDRRPVRLIAANRRWDDVPYREQLATLERALRLRVSHVLSEPPADWQGERGQVDAALLKRVLPTDAAERNVIVAGPPAMTAATRTALLALGIPDAHICVV
jgi:NAD(P)H-flavin reductase